MTSSLGQAQASPSSALAVTGLQVATAGRSPVELVCDVDFRVASGGALAIVGESGSGKSLTLRAVMGILPPNLVATGAVALDERPLPLSGRRLTASRGGRIGMVFQDPLAALDPVMTIGDQVAEAPRRVEGLSRSQASQRALELLGLVRVPDPAGRAGAYPHQLSGGLRQRAVIALALSSRPAFLLCDEPTTALDVTTQAEILALLYGLRRRVGVGVVLVSHDLAVVADVCDEIVVMYSGAIVERGSVAAVLRGPRHPYTAGLLRATPDVKGRRALPDAIPGGLPDPLRRPPGCPFAPRCALVEPACTVARVPLRAVGADDASHESACRRAELVGR